ncbi:MAG: caspase family protein [Hyphomicrobiaceae bacterium]
MQINRAIAIRKWLCIIAAFVAASPAVAADRAALVIGNSDYRHTPKLKNPRNDAIDISASLERLGFKVVAGFDLTKKAMEAKVWEFSDIARNADTALLFYSGHGMQLAGRNYLLPVDARLDKTASVEDETVPFDFIQAILQVAKKNNIIILDACRNNPLRARYVDTVSRSVGSSAVVGLRPGLAKIGAARANTIVSFSTQPDNVALDGAGRNSPYTAALLKFIDRQDLDIASVFVEVRKDVIRRTNAAQVPWENSSLTGQFYFRRRNFAVPGAMEPMTDRPGYDIEDHKQANVSPEACRRACHYDIRCRAWTHVRPGVLGNRPYCFLKNTVPPARKSSCCTSGVKMSGPRR